jgi:microcystin-dependent protein
MANYEATRYNFDGANLTSIQGVNTGIVVPWGSASVPSGFLLCDGTSYSTTTYAALFAVIGYTYGGSGASFNIPDLQDKTVVAASVSNSKSLAQSGGANTVSPTGNIGGSVAATTLATTQIPSHNHTFQGDIPGGGSVNQGSYQVGAGPGNVFNTNDATPAISVNNAGGGQSHTHNLSATFTGSANSVLQPYLVLNYIIKT